MLYVDCNVLSVKGLCGCGDPFVEKRRRIITILSVWKVCIDEAEMMECGCRGEAFTKPITVRNPGFPSGKWLA